MLPTPTPDDAGDASFLGPSQDPSQKADMGSRARARQRPQKQQPKKNSLQASPETQQQQNTVKRIARFARQREKSKDRAAREPATAKAKRTEQKPTAQHSSF